MYSHPIFQSSEMQQSSAHPYFGSSLHLTLLGDLAMAHRSCFNTSPLCFSWKFWYICLTQNLCSESGQTFLTAFIKPFYLSLIIVNGAVFLTLRSSLTMVKNHSHELVHSTSTQPMAIGNIQSFGSMPTALSKIPLNLVFI